MGGDHGGSGPSGFDAMILAGGRGMRLGGRDKAALTVAGQPLLGRALDAVTGAGRVVVVGPVAVPDGVAQVFEDPPDGGPVAGIAAGLNSLRTGREPAPWTCVLAVDQPDAARALAPLLAARSGAGDDVHAVCHRDASGHPQWLLAVYRTQNLLAALAPFGTGHGTPMRALVAELSFRYVQEGVEHVGDVDTWADHARWERRLDGT